MRSETGLALAVLGVITLGSSSAHADPPGGVGVAGTRVIFRDTYIAHGKARVLFLARDSTPGVIHKGAPKAMPGDPPGLDGKVEIFEIGDPSNRAVYTLAAENWVSNRDTGARYEFAGAGPGAPGAGLFVVGGNRPRMKLRAKNFGDGDSLPGDEGATDIDLSTLSVGDMVRVRVTINNAIDADTHVMCSDFLVDQVRPIAQGTGVRVRGQGGPAPSSCGSPSGAFLDDSSGLP